MKSPITETQLIVFSTLLFAVCSLFLFWQNERGLDQNLNKDWWILAFTDPMNESNPTFTVENHSLYTEFRYVISEEKTVLTTESFSLKRGESTTITPPTSEGGKVTITVTTGTQKKEIYR